MTLSVKLTREEAAKMSQRLQACLGIAVKKLYDTIYDDREILSNPASADSLALFHAEERLKRYPVEGLQGDALLQRLQEMAQSVDHGFRILRQFGPSDGGKIADRFVEANQGLVTKFVRRYAHINYLSREELKQIGQLGLCHATLRFNPAKGKFSTVACWWIRSFITRGLTETGRLIRLPVATVSQASAIGRTRRQFWQQHGRSPSFDELAEAVDLSPERLLEVLPHTKPTRSFDAKVFENKAPSTDAATADVVSPESAIMRRQIAFALEVQMDRLSPMEQDVLACQLNLRDDDQHLSFEKLGALYGYSHEGIRKMYRRTLAKLKESLGPDFRPD
jgi:RNA polymerase sigma factor (sigma-70 family)